MEVIIVFYKPVRNTNKANHFFNQFLLRNKGIHSDVGRFLIKRQKMFKSYTYFT